MKRVSFSSAASVQPLEPRLLFAAASLDRTFSGDGKALLDVFGTNDSATAVAVQADGKIVLAGWADVPTVPPGPFTLRRAAVARLNPDGTPDASFGAERDGVVRLTSVEDASAGETLLVSGRGQPDLLPLPDGKTLVLVTAREDTDEGEVTSQVAVLRLTAEGALDRTFGGGDGVAATRFGGSVTSEFDSYSAVALGSAPDGRIVVVGHVTGRRASSVGVARYLADGTLDASFGFRGSGIYQFDTNSEVDASSDANDVVVAPDGDIIIAGANAVDQFDFAVLRLAPNGTVEARATDVLRGSGQSVNYDTARANAVSLLPGGDILVGGFAARSETDSDFALARLNADLTRDSSFGGGDGVVTSRWGATGAAINDLAVLPGDKVLAGGYAGNVFAVSRYNSDGSADITFDSADGTPDGRKTTGFSGAARINALAIDREGKILAAGFAGPDMAVARYEGDRTTTTPPPGDVTVYQAEDGDLSGAEVARGHAGYTGRGYVDFITSAGSYVELNIFVPSDGRYRVDVRYANGGSSSRNMDIILDSGQSGGGSMTFAPTGSWSTWRTASGPTLQVRGGWRFLRFQTVGQNGPNIDSITLTRVGDPPRYEAEQARVVGAAVRRDNFGYSGTGYVDFVHDSGDSVEWTFDVERSGSYLFDFRYANGSSSNRPMALSVDGVLYEPRFAFAPTGGWASWRTTTFGFRLEQGRHTLKLASAGSNGPNIDSMSVRPG